MKITQAPLLPGTKPKRVLHLRNFDQEKRVARVLHLGAGRQSSTLAEMSASGDLSPIDFAIFADTGNEPDWVYGQVDYLAGRVPVVRVSGGNIVEDAKSGSGRFASMPFYTKDAGGNVGRLRRQCTSEYKIKVIRDYLRDWLIEHDYGKVASDGSRRIDAGVYIESWFGISYDEIERLKNRATAWEQDIYPLIDKRMSVRDCLDYLQSHGLPVPGRSSCLVCAFHDDGYWLDLATDRPDLFEEACQFDDWIRSPEAAQRLTVGLRGDVFLHKSCIPLRQVDFAEQPIALPMFCGAHCMT